MACFYSGNKGIFGNLINQQLTGSSVDTGSTASPSFPIEDYDYLKLAFSGANEGNYGISWNIPPLPGVGGFSSTADIPTGALTGSGVILTFPIDLWFNQSSTTITQAYTQWFYSGYSATGYCNVRVYENGGVPQGEFVSTHYGTGVSAYSSIRTTGGGDYTTSGPYYWNIPDHSTTAASAENVRLGIHFSGIKQGYSYDGFMPLRSLP